MQRAIRNAVENMREMGNDFVVIVAKRGHLREMDGLATAASRTGDDGEEGERVDPPSFPSLFSQGERKSPSSTITFCSLA